MTPHSRRTTIASLASVAGVAIAGCFSEFNRNDNDALDSEELAHEFLEDNDANLYDGSFVDRTGEAEVRIRVGGGDDNAFEPPAVRISNGATVIWEWTGDGDHNVVPMEDSEIQDWGQESTMRRDGHILEDTFDDMGAALYMCEPHAAQDAYGALLVV